MNSKKRSLGADSSDARAKQPRTETIATESSLYETLPSSVLAEQKRSQPLIPASQRDFVSDFTRKLLPITQCDSIVETKLVGKVVMLDNTRSKKEPKPHFGRTNLSRKKCKTLGLSRVVSSVGTSKFEDFLPLHKLWQGYIAEVIGANVGAAISDRICRADFHGAYITVVQSKCISNIGICGILLQETEGVVCLITQRNELKTIPKSGNIFTFTHGDNLITLYGNQIRFRASERAKAGRFKPVRTLEL